MVAHITGYKRMKMDLLLLDPNRRMHRLKDATLILSFTTNGTDISMLVNGGLFNGCA